jgi:hypothetical protein
MLIRVKKIRIASGDITSSERVMAISKTHFLAGMAMSPLALCSGWLHWEVSVQMSLVPVVEIF